MFLIVAVSQNFAIGKNNQIPWHLSADLKRFKQITTTCAVIMGKNTYFSIGKPLPNRLNIVVTKDFEKLNLEKDKMLHKNLFFVKNISSAVQLAKESGFIEEKIGIIGGYNIYKEALEKNLIKKIYLTVLNKEAEADVFFPYEFLKNFNEISNEKHFDEKEGNFEFKELERKI